jgi:hypothetical protein
VSYEGQNPRNFDSISLSGVSPTSNSGVLFYSSQSGLVISNGSSFEKVDCISIQDLSGFITSTPSSGHVLAFSGTEGQIISSGVTIIDQLESFSDFTGGPSASGDLLRRNGSSQWYPDEFTGGGGGSTALSSPEFQTGDPGLRINSLVNNSYLEYDSTSQVIVNLPVSNMSLNLTISNTSGISSNTDLNDFLSWNGSFWVPKAGMTNYIEEIRSTGSESGVRSYLDFPYFIDPAEGEMAYKIRIKNLTLSNDDQLNFRVFQNYIPTSTVTEITQRYYYSNRVTTPGSTSVSTSAASFVNAMQILGTKDKDIKTRIDVFFGLMGYPDSNGVYGNGGDKHVTIQGDICNIAEIGDHNDFLGKHFGFYTNNFELNKLRLYTTSGSRISCDWSVDWIG